MPCSFGSVVVVGMVIFVQRAGYNANGIYAMLMAIWQMGGLAQSGLQQLCRCVKDRINLAGARDNRRPSGRSLWSRASVATTLANLSPSHHHAHDDTHVSCICESYVATVAVGFQLFFKRRNQSMHNSYWFHSGLFDSEWIMADVFELGLKGGSSLK